MEGFRLLGIPGSIREGSYNRKVLEYVGELLPVGCSYEIFDGISQIPFYDQSYEDNLPEIVVALRNAVRQADGLIVSTPEHNASIPAALKNALEWLSRPVGDGPIERKPVAILGAAPGLYGTIRSQMHLRQILHSTGAFVVQKPEVYINQVATKFDEQGVLNDELAVTLLTGMIAELEKLILQHRNLNEGLSKDDSAA